jgi:hypothetical protein
MAAPAAELRVAWLVLPRSGSQFLVKLTTALLGKAVSPHSSLTPGRWEKALPGLMGEAERENRFREAAAAGHPEAYFAGFGARSVKIERPFGDALPEQVRAACPDCRFIASIRPFAQMADSHASLAWGLPAPRLLEIYAEHVARLTRFAAESEVFFIDIERREGFDADLFAAWLATSSRPPFRRLVRDWPLVNARAERVAKDGAREAPMAAPDAALLVEGAALDARMRALAAESEARIRARLGG